ncbi:hypothetical protein EVAR_51463_1 [Eumeta japonica]|uniref:Uncharacterized protein n=1 Tax=Eumeta variegata TaxID=151549 RepID=A0A4C1XRA5_EUMVA|nr:hypothetical protein EVAR_51463_1 [Eumeta japonica]
MVFFLITQRNVLHRGEEQLVDGRRVTNSVQNIYLEDDIYYDTTAPHREIKKMWEGVSQRWGGIRRKLGADAHTHHERHIVCSYVTSSLPLHIERGRCGCARYHRAADVYFTFNSSGGLD